MLSRDQTMILKPASPTPLPGPYKQSHQERETHGAKTL